MLSENVWQRTSESLRHRRTLLFFSVLRLCGSRQVVTDTDALYTANLEMG